MEAFISYDGLPIKSGGSHGLGNKPVEGLYSQCLGFINNHTEVGQLKVDITLYSSDNKNYSSWPLLWKMIKKFGVLLHGIAIRIPTEMAIAGDGELMSIK